MAYNHGVKVSEVPTSVLPPVRATAGIPFVVGTAPVYMTDINNVNKPVLCYTYDEAVEAFGYEEPKNGKHEFTLCEFMKSHFALFGASPVIMVNVANFSLKENEFETTGNGEGTTLPMDAVVIKVETNDPVSGGRATLELGEKYTVTYDSTGCKVGILGGFPFAMTFFVTYAEKSAITSTEIIGGVDTDGNKTGLELVNECFPRFRLVPGIILAPGFSGDSAVAAVIAAKAANINEHFSCIGIVDVPTDTVKKYSDVAAWKNTNNITDERLVCCWPKLSLGGVQYHQSTQLAGLIARTDGENDDVPYVSPSNKNYQMDSAVLEDGTEVWLSPDTANYLNSQGIVTALNFMDGWKCWGNRTAKYPGGTDVKDTFIPIRRMFAWIGNTLIQTFWQKVDAPLNRRQIDTIVDSANMWLNGLTAKEYILGGRVEFLESENPTTDLMDGIARFHVYITPPSPNREIDFVLEYDPAYVETLFA